MNKLKLLFFMSLLISSPFFGLPLFSQPLPTPPAPTTGLSLNLEVFTTTMTQIILKWEDPYADTVSYQLQRDTDPAFPTPQNYSIAEGSANFKFRIFSDTNRYQLENHKQLFSGHPWAGPLLERETVYYYRLKAVHEGGGEEVSNIVSARVSGPVRGVEGDLWADVVIGQSDFGHNAIRKTNAYAVQRPAGFLIDHENNRTYIADGNRNRIIGFNRIIEDPEQPADIVIGQPGFVDYSGGNGDSTHQFYPYLPPASAESLRIAPAGQTSMTETDCFTNMAVDDEGNLYVADLFNNRVLKYNNPFEDDTVADQVWGQSDYMGIDSNRGSDTPANNGFFFDEGNIPIAGVDIDWEGNLWVADKDNHRVLRFPKVGEEIASQADLVLGQPDFQTNVPGDDLAAMRETCDVEIDKERRRVYICDRSHNVTSRIRVFEPPFSNGMLPTKSISGAVTNPENFIYQLKLDNQIHGIWIRYRFGEVELKNLETLETVVFIDPDFEGPIDIDQNGNLFIASRSFWSRDVSRYDYPLFSNQTTVFSAQLVYSADTLGQLMGATIFGDQLIIGDHYRVVIYHDYHNLITGQAADDVWGQDSLEAINNPYVGFRFPAVDSRGRLWLIKQHHADVYLLAFNYPLSHNSQPVNTIHLAGNITTIPVLGGGEIAIAWWAFQDFAIEPSGDKIWIADEPNSRVVRLSGINPGESPYIDVILGQSDSQSTLPNMGGSSPAADTLSMPKHVAVDRAGNIFVSDTGGESGFSNCRILQWEASTIPSDPEEAVFAVPADRVFGTGGDFNITGKESIDPICQPNKTVIDSNGIMVAGMNPYGFCQRFPLVYLDPMNDQLPQFALGDWMSRGEVPFFDPEGNLYITDQCWNRILIYHRPFKDFTGYLSPEVLYPILSSGDYDGDGVSDIAIFRPSSSLWAVRDLTRCYFGKSGDIPVSGDYDGDGTTDITIFREDTGLWAARGISRYYFGTTGDIPVPGDYDGDSTVDPGIFRQTSGLWAIRDFTRCYYGDSNDLAAPEDYNGDFTSDIAVFRPSTGLWAIKELSRCYFGRWGDWPVPADYAGEGTSSISIFRAFTGLWAIRGLTREYFGTVYDQPVPADYTGNGADDIGIFRSSTSLWAVPGVTRAYFGREGDEPVTK